MLHDANTSHAQEVPTTRFERAVFLQEMLVDRATGGHADDGLYRTLRRELMLRPEMTTFVPSFLRDWRTISGFWSWIKGQSPSWEPRRALIRESFAELLEKLEAEGGDPADTEIMSGLSSFSADGVREAWEKALSRRKGDPEGAITVARSLLETVCKLVIDDTHVIYDETADLPQLYRIAAK